MKKIDIICILDMSGSMSSIIQSARDGFNKFLNEQKQSKHKIKISLMFFDTNFYMPYKHEKIKNVKEVDEKTYRACGATALHDAIGFCIDDYFDYMGETPIEKRPDKTLFVILTDGEENSSKVYQGEQIKRMITHLREELNVEFIFLAANQDACFVAESMGIDKSNAFNYAATNDGISVAYASLSKATSYYADNDVKANLFQQ